MNWTQYTISKNYFYQFPIHKLSDLVNEFGYPSCINKDRNGIAVWDSSSLKGLYTRIDLVDKLIYNPFPVPHIGFMYIYYRYNLPINKLSQVLSLSNDIKYDISEKTLIIRGMALGYCNQILVNIIKFCKGELSWYQLASKKYFVNSLNYNNLTNINIINYNKEFLQKNKYSSIK